MRLPSRLARLLVRQAGSLAVFLFAVATAALVSAQSSSNLPAGASASGRARVNPAPGGAAAADFDALIDLIQSTVAADSWLDNGTGEGTIQPFGLNGVYVDASGSLRTMEADGQATMATRLAGAPGTKRPAAAFEGAAVSEADPRRPSRLRFVSLPRLEATIAESQRTGRPLDPAVLTLAGLQRVAYVLVYPESGDLVLAGPAGDWQADAQGRLVSAASGQPVVRLDDLLTLWRRQQKYRAQAFGCSINPRQSALAKTQAFLASTATRSLEPGERGAWLSALRRTLGEQDVEYFNIDPETRVAGVLLAADYHMKLVGMGLVQATPGVHSYLATVRLDEQGQPPPLAVLRWWFSMPASQVAAADQRRAFQLPRRCVQVQSENQLLADRGERVPTGESEPLNRRFAESFTAEFAALSAKYPIYAELQRIFELALALALIEQEGLAETAGWTPTWLLDQQELPLPKAVVLRSVETVVNHRVLERRHIIAGVSGGVWIDPREQFEVRVHQKQIARPQRAESEASAWWWDAR